jgi:hypothetical protein
MFALSISLLIIDGFAKHRVHDLVVRQPERVGVAPRPVTIPPDEAHLKARQALNTPENGQSSAGQVAAQWVAHSLRYVVRQVYEGARFQLNLQAVHQNIADPLREISHDLVSNRNSPRFISKYRTKDHNSCIRMLFLRMDRFAKHGVHDLVVRQPERVGVALRPVTIPPDEAHLKARPALNTPENGQSSPGQVAAQWVAHSLRYVVRQVYEGARFHLDLQAVHQNIADPLREPSHDSARVAELTLGLIAEYCAVERICRRPIPVDYELLVWKRILSPSRERRASSPGRPPLWKAATPGLPRIHGRSSRWRATSSRSHQNCHAFESAGGRRSA